MDWPHKLEGLQVTLSRVLQLRPASIVLPTPMAGGISREWAEWGGGDFSHIYTDGSHAMDKNFSQFLLGTGNRKVGGAIIISDGQSWVHRIFVVIDVEARKAFDVELICILIANEMAMARGGRITINSDCEAAIKAAIGGYSAGFSNLINNWTLGGEVSVKKVRAHPKRFKHHTEWDWDDKGIWTADRVAGAEMTHES